MLTPLAFASASPDAFVPFGTVPQLRDRLRRAPRHSAVGKRWRPSGPAFAGSYAALLYSLASARLTLWVHLRWLQLDHPMVSFQSLGCNISFWLSLTMSFTQRTQRSQRGAAPVGLPVPIFHSSFFIMPFPDDVFHAKDATIAKGCRPRWASPVPSPFFIFHSSLCISLTG
jgi:hypothetical protein